jgi:squalene-hopene/tetraprenyl-beta-curcumene cyclase
MPGAEGVARQLLRSETEPDLDRAIDAATAELLAQQRLDGHWVFELEADATISAEYIALQHFLGERDPALEARIARYLRRLQGPHGGWPLVHGGPVNNSASVKAYFALKLVGDSTDAEHMRRARDAILAAGGAGNVNVFTRILLALHGILSWGTVPVVPVELMLLPRWFPFHLARVSYWTRTVLVPLLVLQALKPRARNPQGVRIDELFPGSRPHARRSVRAPHQSRIRFALSAAMDAILHWAEPFIPERLRRRAIERAVAFVAERLNGEDGLGAIFPAMANAVMMFDALGYPRDHPQLAMARGAIDRLLVIGADEAYCQPCVSPVWDTALACMALLDVGDRRALSAAHRGLVWLAHRQVLDTAGDWKDQRPHVRPGGWAFQYANPHYPDLDDTAVVVMAMHRHAHLPGARDEPLLRNAIHRGREWVLGMQSANGGWGAFDADNVSEYLNDIPFADHGALLDPPTADVTARCAAMLAQLGDDADEPALAAALAFLRRSQEADGTWYGRWGMNYIYGTWSVLWALAEVGESVQSPEVRRAVDWLIGAQNPDGGWGETADTYDIGYTGDKCGPSTASQTAWALLGLMVVGATHYPSVARGIDYLQRTQGATGFWPEPQFTATGFPRVFFLRYHGYAKFFPVWALARYRALQRQRPGVHSAV